MTANFAGQRGWCLLSGNFVPAADIATHWPSYVAGAEQAGRRPDPSVWRVGRSVLITDSDAEAQEILDDPEGTFTWYYTYLNAQGKLAGGDFNTDIDWAAAKAEAMVKAKDLVIAGTASTVLDRLIAFRDQVGDFGTLMLTGHDMEGALPLWRRSFTTLAETVWPKLSAYMADKRMSAAAE